MGASRGLGVGFRGFGARAVDEGFSIEDSGFRLDGFKFQLPRGPLVYKS